MINSTEDQINEVVIDSAEHISNKINDAIATLDRNIAFVSNCDNKTSIVLTAMGVFLTIILTNDGLVTIFNIVKTCISQKNFCNILFLLCFIVSIGVLLFGFYNLCSVLIARTKNTASSNSNIFFSGIIKNGNRVAYRGKFITMTQEEYLDDLISEIYINAEIATIKYRKYNVGFKCSTIGFIAFVVMLLIGIEYTFIADEEVKLCHFMITEKEKIELSQY